MAGAKFIVGFPITKINGKLDQLLASGKYNSVDSNELTNILDELIIIVNDSQLKDVLNDNQVTLSSLPF